MRRLIELSRYVVAVPAVGSIIGAFILMVIGTWEILRSLVKLFVDADAQLPPWLEIRSLDDLKAKLIGVVVAIIAVVFLGVLVDATEANDIMLIGIGAGAVVFGLAAFTYATRKEPGSKPQQP